MLAAGHSRGAMRADGIELTLHGAMVIEVIVDGELELLRLVRAAGIEPQRQHMRVVKAAGRWRGGYLPITKHHIDVDTPGSVR